MVVYHFRYLESLEDPSLKGKWIACKDKIEEEVEIVKKIEKERLSFVIPHVNERRSQSPFSKSIDNFAKDFADNDGVWDPPAEAPPRRESAAGRLSTRKSIVDGSDVRSSKLRSSADARLGGYPGKNRGGNAGTSGRASLSNTNKKKPTEKERRGDIPASKMKKEVSGYFLEVPWWPVCDRD